jgi:hypothetical protein
MADADADPFAGAGGDEGADPFAAPEGGDEGADPFAVRQLMMLVDFAKLRT